jgi:hypothetical protein
MLVTGIASPSDVERRNDSPLSFGDHPDSSLGVGRTPVSCAMMSQQMFTHSSQMKTAGPAINFFTFE